MTLTKFQRSNISYSFHAFTYKAIHAYINCLTCENIFLQNLIAFNTSENELQKLRFSSFTLRKVVLCVWVNLNPNKFIHIALRIQTGSDS